MHDLSAFKSIFYELPVQHQCRTTNFCNEVRIFFGIMQHHHSSIVHQDRQCIPTPEQRSRPTITYIHQGAAKRFFKALFVGTLLSIALRNTNMSEAVLDGIKPQECERGSGRSKPPIPYIQKKDELQEAVESTVSIKLTLPTKVELRVSVWSRSSLEKFIMHVQQAIEAIKAKGLQDNYEKPFWAKKECMEKLKEAVLNHDLVEGEVRDDSPVAKADFECSFVFFEHGR